MVLCDQAVRVDRHVRSDTLSENQFRRVRSSRRAWWQDSPQLWHHVQHLVSQAFVVDVWVSVNKMKDVCKRGSDGGSDANCGIGSRAFVHA